MATDKPCRHGPFDFAAARLRSGRTVEVMDYGLDRYGRTVEVAYYGLDR